MNKHKYNLDCLDVSRPDHLVLDNSEEVHTKTV